MIKRLLLIVLTLVLISINGFSQDVIKFLGIPVDGIKREMIAELEKKGYRYNVYDDCLEGEFNGQDVFISVQTVNNRVWRITVVDQRSTDETNIRIRFNNLYYQFLNNGRYILARGNIIDENERIGTQISVYKKRYEATFFPSEGTSNGIVWFMIGQEDFDEYRICIYYENLNNAASGDDL